MSMPKGEVPAPGSKDVLVFAKAFNLDDAPVLLAYKYAQYGAEWCHVSTKHHALSHGGRRVHGYGVRDNGSVLHHKREGKCSRPLDGNWTFGNTSKSDGYMAISSHKVHRIVAEAFRGELSSKRVSS